MTVRTRLGVALAAAALAAAAAPASAFAHAALLRTSPVASKTLVRSPTEVALTYSEPVEPGFAIVSVTNAAGTLEISGSPHASPANADQLVVPVRHLAEGWYLVFWRVISADGHPVRGAFTFAVGPNPGPAPQFPIPSTSETAATAPLVATRWIVFLSLMTAVGVAAFRLVLVRPARRLEPAIPMRALSALLAGSLVVTLLAIPVYLVLATAEFALRSWTDLADIVPLLRDSALGRAFETLELVTALFGLACLCAALVERPDRKQRSIAELLAMLGVLASGAALLAVPGLAGHAAQTSPAALALGADWLHVAAGAIWIGGLAALAAVAARTVPARRLPVLVDVVPRFSNVAFVSVLVLIASGVAASIVHLPTLSTLWTTTYGRWIIVKVGLLVAAMLLAAVQLARTKPRLAAAGRRRDEALGTSATTLLRRLVAGETVLITAAIGAATVLTSLPPPPKALASLAEVSAHVGPGPVARTVTKNGYRVKVAITPNRAAQPNAFRVDVSQGGAPVRGATVIAHFEMLDMEMGELAYTLQEQSPGTYGRSAPALVMVGHWAVSFEVEPRGAQPFKVLLVDETSG